MMPVMTTPLRTTLDLMRARTLVLRDVDHALGAVPRHRAQRPRAAARGSRRARAEAPALRSGHAARGHDVRHRAAARPARADRPRHAGVESRRRAARTGLAHRRRRAPRRRRGRLGRGGRRAGPRALLVVGPAGPARRRPRADPARRNALAPDSSHADMSRTVRQPRRPRKCDDCADVPTTRALPYGAIVPRNHARLAGGLYHVTSRGNRRRRSSYDESTIGSVPARASAVRRRVHGWHCHAYCLMTNHYHLIVETPEDDLSRGHAPPETASTRSGSTTATDSTATSSRGASTRSRSSAKSTFLELSATST